MGQTALGDKKLHKHPKFTDTKIGRITATKGYKDYGRIEVIFLDYSQPCPVWVTGHVDREPVEGDQVLVGFIDGRADAPYLIGFIRNESYTANFISVEKGAIKIQLPVIEALKDIKENLLDDSKASQRAYVIVKSNSIEIHHPDGDINIIASGTINLG